MLIHYSIVKDKHENMHNAWDYTIFLKNTVLMFNSVLEA